MRDPDEGQGGDAPADVGAPAGRHALETPAEDAFEGAARSRLRAALHAARRAGDEAGALARARELRALDPSDQDALRTLEAHHRAMGSPETLRDVLVDAARTGAVTDRLARLREAAELSEGALGEPGPALACWQSVLALDPTADDARAAVPRLLEAQERWDALAAHLEQESLAAIDPEEKARILLRQARLARGPGRDPVAAIAAYRARLALLPGDGVAFDELLALLLGQGHGAEAVALIERRRPRLRGEAGVALLRQLADAQEQLLAHEAAYETSRRVLALAAAPDVRRAELERMARLDETLGQHARLTETLSRLASLQESRQRAATLRRLGDLARTGRGDLALAAERYREALALDPSSEPLLDALSATYADAGRFEDLVRVLEEHAEGMEPGLASALLRRIARTLEDHARERASDAWERLLRGGEDVEALRALAGHARDRGDDVAHVRWLARLAEALRTVDARAERIGVLRRLAAAARARGDVGGARRALGELLHAVPRDLDALEALEALEAQAGNHTRRAELLEARLAQARTPPARRALALTLADLHRDVRDDRAAEADALRIALAETPDDDALALRLARALGDAGQAGAQLAVLDARAEAAAARFDAKTAAAYVRAAAKVAVDALGDADGAWRRLAPLALSDATALDQLRAMADAVGAQARFADLRVRHARFADGPTAAEAWEDAARAYEGGGDGAKAFEAMLRSLALDLGDTRRLAIVDRLGRALGAYGRLAQVYERLLGDATDPVHERALRLRLADVLEEAGGTAEALRHCLQATETAVPEPSLVMHIADLARRAEETTHALAAFEAQAARTDEPARIEALMALGHHLASHEALEQALSRLFANTLDAEVARSLLRHRAQLLAHTLSRPGDAAPLFARLAAMTGRVDDLRAELAAWTAAGAHDARVALLARLARDTEGTERIDYLRQLARAWEHDLDNRWEAIEAWTRLTRIVPDDAEARDALARLH